MYFLIACSCHLITSECSAECINQRGDDTLSQILVGRYFPLQSLTGWEETACLFLIFDQKERSAKTEVKSSTLCDYRENIFVVFFPPCNFSASVYFLHCFRSTRWKFSDSKLATFLLVNNA